MKIIKPETVEKLLEENSALREPLGWWEIRLENFTLGIRYAYKQLLEFGVEEFGVEELEEEKLDTDPCGDTIEYDGKIRNKCIGCKWDKKTLSRGYDGQCAICNRYHIYSDNYEPMGQAPTGLKATAESDKRKIPGVEDGLKQPPSQSVVGPPLDRLDKLADAILKVVLESLPEKKKNKIETDLNHGLMNIGWNECLIEIAQRLKGE